MTYVRATPVSIGEVREAVAWLIPAMSATHSFDSYTMYYAAAKKLNINVSGYYQDGVMAQIADRLYGQVKRALDLFASRGILVKIGKNQKHPGGWSNGSIYYRPEALEAAQERARLARIEADLTETRWALIYDQLIARGIVITSKRGEQVALGLDMFERIVDQLESA